MRDLYRLPLLLLPFWAAIWLGGCSNDEPLQVGLIAGTSGRVADLGVGGRNGMILATEQFNARGGIHGRPIELLIRDDQQDPQRARQHAQELIDKEVAAILGPMTSAMALAIEPMTTQANLVLLGGTVATNQLTGKDDSFFRILAPTKAHASNQARNQLRQGINHFAIAIDTNNRSYTQDWADDFSFAFQQGGGRVAPYVEFHSSAEAPFSQIAKQLIDTGAQAIALAGNSIDTALLAQQLRLLNPDIRIVACEWAATERLIELGGRGVEGIVVAQYIDRSSQEPDYLNFRQQFIARFGQEPGYTGLIGYNAASALYQAMQQQRDDESLKQALLRISTFEGVQGDTVFDRYGDSTRPAILTEVVNGQFQQVK
jgi:branched-chain amino acid transport system substrate-binding protein